MRRLVIAAVFLMAGTVLFSLRGNQPFGNNDEIIYAQCGLEMAQGGDWSTIHWQGKPIFSRAPGSIWPLALAFKLGAPSPRAVRFPFALASAISVCLLFLLGARRYGETTGVIAAIVFATSAVWLQYARVIVSETLLLTWIIAAFLCWEKGRERPAWIVGWGACVGFALLTKQIVGALPLLAPALDLLARRKLPRRELLMAGGVAVFLTVPWFVREWIHYGRPFISEFLLRNVVARSARQLHQSSTPSFYLEVLWRREGPLIIICALGLVHAAVRRDWLLVLWAVGVLALFSLAASRYDYYMLVAYPALALAASRAVVDLGRRYYLHVITAGVWAALHVVPALEPTTPIDPETGRLAQIVVAQSRPDDPLLVVEQIPYSARYYAQRWTLQIVFDAAEYDEIRFIQYADVAFASDIATIARQFPRWFAIVPKVDLARAGSLGPVHPLAESPRYVLLTNVPPH